LAEDKTSEFNGNKTDLMLGETFEKRKKKTILYNSLGVVNKINCRRNKRKGNRGKILVSRVIDRLRSVSLHRPRNTYREKDIYTELRYRIRDKQKNKKGGETDVVRADGSGY
jgi:hypothetical protein